MEVTATEFLDIRGGRISYRVAGEGQLIVLSHGVGNRRQVFRFLAPRLLRAGFRVVSAAMRGHGESASASGNRYPRPGVGGELVALIRHLDGGPAVIVGNSLCGGPTTIAAAT
jgi:pimeloyl-ACP methyl ester carboxylesterase